MQKVDLRCGLEPASKTALELRAPQHDVEVVCDGRKIAIDRRRCQRTQLLPDLRHAIGHHAEGDEVFADILRTQIPLP